MSHFITVVLMPAATEDILDKVAEMLTPYDENLEVEEHDEECYCVGNKAEREGRDSVKFSERLDEKRNDPAFQALTGDEVEKVWAEFVAGLKAEAKPFIESHPLFQKPNPECSDCAGTGTFRTTSNPDSKWDWYTIGGRWDGWIHGPKIEESSRDKKDGGFNFDAEHHTLVNNCLPVACMRLDDYAHMPFAIITPDGEWHEHGNMGWWGIVHDEKDDWQTVARQILEKHTGCIAVTVDCHI